MQAFASAKQLSTARRDQRNGINVKTAKEAKCVIMPTMLVDKTSTDVHS